MRQMCRQVWVANVQVWRCDGGGYGGEGEGELRTAGIKTEIKLGKLKRNWQDEVGGRERPIREATRRRAREDENKKKTTTKISVISPQKIIGKMYKRLESCVKV